MYYKLIVTNNLYSLKKNDSNCLIWKNVKIIHNYPDHVFAIFWTKNILDLL